MYALIVTMPLAALLLAVKSGAHLLETFTAWLYVVVTLRKPVLLFLRLFHPLDVEGGLFCFHSDFSTCFFSPRQGEPESADTDNAPQVPPPGMNVSPSPQEHPTSTRPVRSPAAGMGELSLETLSPGVV